VLVYACSEAGYRLHEVRRLFPTGYLRGACRIAGISFEFMANCNIWLTYENPTRLASRYPTDDDGFLTRAVDWTEDFAHFIVNQSDAPDGLTDAHLRLIVWLRESYASDGAIPSVEQASQANSLPPAEIERLFPEGFRRGACRAAGLPAAAMD
jgi:tRNA 2-thiouridine synthesizing protein E